MNIQHERASLIDMIKASGDSVRAQGEKKYLKSNLNFYGCPVPTLHRIAKTWAKAHRDVPIETVAALAAGLWESDWHDERSLAIFLLQETVARLTLAQLPLLEHMMRQVNTWAHLDEIAIHLVGALALHEPELRPHLFRWAVDENFWVRRTAVLAHNLAIRKGNIDLEQFEQIVVPMLNEGRTWSADERFFIRKAIGWSLRELATRRPDWVVAFVQRHRSAMSGLTLREATRKLPPEWASRLDPAL